MLIVFRKRRAAVNVPVLIGVIAIGLVLGIVLLYTLTMVVVVSW